jgi:hypothetical protein
VGFFVSGVTERGKHCGQSISRDDGFNADVSVVMMNAKPAALSTRPGIAFSWKMEPKSRRCTEMCRDATMRLIAPLFDWNKRTWMVTGKRRES